MCRKELLLNYAEALSDKPIAAGDAFGYDVEIERERLQLQKMEIEYKRLAREWDMKRHAEVMDIKRV